MHPSGDEIRSTVSIEICNRQGNKVRGRRRDVVQRELLPAVIFQPDQAPGCRILPSVVGADEGDIHIAVAIEVGRLDARGA